MAAARSPRSPTPRWLAALLVLALACAAPASRPPPAPAGSTAGGRPTAGGGPSTPVRAPAPAPGLPRLVVLVSVDQLAASYLERLEPVLSDRGFRRLAREGASFTSAEYPYAVTQTGPGHASIGTGAPPAATGIVANLWVEDGRPRYCAADPRAQAVVEEGGTLARRARASYAPTALDADALGDRVRERHPGAKVVAVSWKERAAILMAGRRADAAYWLDEAEGRFGSSTYYLGASAAALGFAHPCLGKHDALPAACPWQLWRPADDLAPSALPPGALQVGTDGQAEPPGLERRPDGAHAIRNLTGLTMTPFGNTLLLEFARHVARAHRLGEDDVPDLLLVSLSSQDFLGHRVGPDALETNAAVVRLDRDLAAFVDDLEREVGKGRLTVALTADHGIQSLPEVSRARGKDAGRATLDHARLDAAIAGAAGLASPGPAGGAGAVPERDLFVFADPNLYVRWSALARAPRRPGADPLRPELVRAALRDAVAKEPGVSRAFASADLLAPCFVGCDAEREAVRLGFRSDRSGDVVVTLREGWIWKDPGSPAAHGQPVHADRHVPLLLWGAGVARGAHAERVTPLQLAPTLAKLLGTSVGAPGVGPLEAALVRGEPGPPTSK